MREEPTRHQPIRMFPNSWTHFPIRCPSFTSGPSSEELRAAREPHWAQTGHRSHSTITPSFKTTVQWCVPSSTPTTKPLQNGSLSPPLLILSGFGPNSYLTQQYTANNLAEDEAIPYTDWWLASGNPASGSSYYFMNPNIGGSVRGKDGFMLISAGIDRTYGTTDDIIVTP